jgi:hypothetical protein
MIDTSNRLITSLRVVNVAHAWRVLKYIRILAVSNRILTVWITDSAMIWDTVCTITLILRCFDHGWQLQLLIVRIEALVSCILLLLTNDFFIQRHPLH